MTLHLFVHSCFLHAPSEREDGGIPQDVLENRKRLKGPGDCGHATGGTTKGKGRPGLRVGEGVFLWRDAIVSSQGLYRGAQRER